MSKVGGWRVLCKQCAAGRETNTPGLFPEDAVTCALCGAEIECFPHGGLNYGAVLSDKEWLDEVEKLASKASAGPWWPHEEAGIASKPPSYEPRAGAISSVAMPWLEEDARFIAAARTLVPELVEELREAHARIEQLEVQLAEARRIAFGEVSGPPR